MPCSKCEAIVERSDLPHVVRKCEGCGRELRIHERGPHGIGFNVRKGDQVVIPSDWLKLSLNPLKSSGQFSRYGLGWFAQQIHLEDLPKKKEEIHSEIDRIQARCDTILSNSKIIEGLDLENEEHAEEIINRLKANQDTPEWWAFLMGTFISFLRDAMETGNVQQAVWAMGCVERCRSMLLFKEHLEEVVWMGQSAKRVVDILRTWDGNKTNDDEAFWQITFRENVYAISQVFAVPIVFIKDAAYVGGMNIDRQNAKLVDYFSRKNLREKPFLWRLRHRQQRSLALNIEGHFDLPLSWQALSCRLLTTAILSKNLSGLVEGTNYKLSAFSPKCVVIIGNGAAELATEDKREAFEMFRANSRDVEIITYDELFRKIEVLASLFSLTRTKQ